MKSVCTSVVRKREGLTGLTIPERTGLLFQKDFGKPTRKKQKRKPKNEKKKITEKKKVHWRHKENTILYREDQSREDTIKE